MNKNPPSDASVIFAVMQYLSGMFSIPEVAANLQVTENTAKHICKGMVRCGCYVEASDRHLKAIEKAGENIAARTLATAQRDAANYGYHIVGNDRGFVLNNGAGNFRAVIKIGVEGMLCAQSAEYTEPFWVGPRLDVFLEDWLGATYTPPKASPAARVAKSQAKAISKGAVRLQCIITDPEAIEALRLLTRLKATQTAAVSSALISAKRMLSLPEQN